MGCSPSGEANEKIEALTKEVTVKESTIAKLKADLDSSIAQGKKEEIEELRKERDNLKAEIASLQSAHEHCQATISSLEQSKTDTASELASVRATIEVYTHDLEAHKMVKSDLEAQLQAASQANSQATAALQAQVAQQADSISALTSQLSSLQDERNSLKDQLDITESLLGETREECEKLAGSVKTLTKAVEEEKERTLREVDEARAGAVGGTKHRDCLKMSQKCMIGVTGKYYCSKKIRDEEDFCGPLKGSNCSKCQQLDIESRDLPRGFLVNSDGRICRRGGDGMNWFCGAGVMQGVSGCDGYCGPTNGPNCQPCREMQHLVSERYRKLIS